jgi:competence protein ComEC
MVGEDELLVAFLDVGQGDASVILLPGGRQAVLVDCGRGGSAAVLDYLRQSSILELPLVFMTHSDEDHVGGMLEVLDNFWGTVGALAFLPDRVVNMSENPHYRHLLRGLGRYKRQQPCAYWRPVDGKTRTLQGTTLTVLHPADEDHWEAVGSGQQNESSVVLRIEYLGRRFLLAADAERRAWRWMLSRQTDIRADVFKCPHHGGWDPRLPQILSLVSAHLLVISVGSMNSHSHPQPKTLAALRAYTSAGGKRLMCTQVTRRCNAGVRSAVGCAGTVAVSVSPNGVFVTPTEQTHDAIVNGWSAPQCR